MGKDEKTPEQLPEEVSQTSAEEETSKSSSEEAAETTDQRGKFKPGGMSLSEIRRRQEETQREEELAARRTESQLRDEYLEEKEEQKKWEDENPQSKTRKKVDNFFYHYRTPVVITALIVLFVGLFIKDVFFAPKPDMTIILSGGRPVPMEIVDTINEQISPIVGDQNEDGQEMLTIDAIKIPSSNPPVSEDEEDTGIQSDFEAEAAGMMKLMAVIAAGQEHLFLLDDDAKAYISQGESLEEIFEPLELDGHIVYGIPFDETILAEDNPYTEYLSEFAFYVRIPMEREKEDQLREHALAMEVVEQLLP